MMTKILTLMQVKLAIIVPKGCIYVIIKRKLYKYFFYFTAYARYTK